MISNHIQLIGSVGCVAPATADVRSHLSLISHPYTITDLILQARAV